MRPSDILVKIYDRALMKSGDTPTGALYSSEEYRQRAFNVLLDVIRRPTDGPVTLVDFGCGTGGLLEYIRSRGLADIVYVGADRSALALSYARRKFPDVTFLEIDVASPDADIEKLSCDYFVASGLFVLKGELTHEEMWSFLSTTVRRVWPFVRRGLAFNVMSKIVDWERDDLFHLPMDDAARLLHELAGRNVQIRADYDSYEYTAFAWRADK